MSKHEQIASAAYSNGTQPPVVSQWDEPSLVMGLRVDLHTTLPGPVELEAAPDHRLMIHAGDPVRGAYRAHRVQYVRGDIDMFPAGLSESWEADEVSTALVLQFSPLLLHRAAEGTGRDPVHAGLEPKCQVRDAQIEHIAWALDAERMAGYPSGLLYTESLGLALAVHLISGHMAPVRQPAGLSKQQLRHLQTYIEEHLDQNLSLAVLADVVGVSVSHLKPLFRRLTGLPVHEYVVQRRAERAKALLLHSELPASQVALEAGFAHQSHMARCMRRVLGVTPTLLVRSSRLP